MKVSAGLALLVAVTMSAMCYPLGAAAATVTFDWVQTAGALPATGSVTLSSPSLTAQDASGATQFNLTGTGSTALAEVSSFSFSFDGHTLSSITSNSTGWRDNYPGEPINVLESTWTASHTFGNGSPPVGTLQVAGNSTQYSTVTFGSASATGEWELVPPTTVPLSGSALFLISGSGLLLRARSRAPSRSSSLLGCAARSGSDARCRSYPDRRIPN